MTLFVNVKRSHNSLRGQVGTPGVVFYGVMGFCRTAGVFVRTRNPYNKLSMNGRYDQYAFSCP